MEHEAPNELDRREVHRLPLLSLSVVFPAERHTAVRQGDEPSVRDSDTVCVAGQILEHLLRTAKRLLGVDDPRGGIRLVDQAIEIGLLLQRRQGTLKSQIAASAGRLEFLEKLCPIDDR